MNNVILTGAIEIQEQAQGAAWSPLRLLFNREVRNFGEVRFWHKLLVGGRGFPRLARLEQLIQSSQRPRHLAPRLWRSCAGSQEPLHESIQKSATVAVAKMEGLFFNVHGGYV